MLILYESAVGYTLFRVLDEDKLKTKNIDNIYKEFESQSKRDNFIQLHAFQAFKDMDEAQEAAKCLIEGMDDYHFIFEKMRLCFCILLLIHSHNTMYVLLSYDLLNFSNFHSKYIQYY